MIGDGAETEKRQRVKNKENGQKSGDMRGRLLWHAKPRGVPQIEVTSRWNFRVTLFGSLSKEFDQH